MKELVKILALGSNVTLCLLLPILLGRWIDVQLKLSPFGVLFGMVLGLMLALYKLYDIVK